MSKGFKSNVIIVVLLILTIGVITLGIKNDKKARAKDIEDVKIYEAKNTASAKKPGESTNKKADKEKEDTLDVYGKLQSGKDIKILVVGDSIGKSLGKTKDDAAWDVKVKKLIEDKYKSKCSVENISEDSAVAYKGYSEIMKNDIKDFDLAIVCFGGSDEQATTKDDFSITYETVIRQLKKRNTGAEIITVLENTMNNKKFIDVIKDVSKNYNLDMIDGIAAYNDSPLSKKDMMANKSHPNDKGYELYADAIFKLIEKNVDAKKTVSKELQKAINADADSFDKFNFVTKYDSNDGFDVKDDAVISTKDNSEIIYKTSASKVGISYLDMKGGGKIEIFVNGKFAKKIDTNSDRDIKKAKLVADNLKGENTIKIKSQGRVVKVFGIITN